MSTWLTDSASVTEYLSGLLAASPSGGLIRMVEELLATGLPIRFETQPDLPVGTAQLRRDGIEISLPAGGLDEGAVGYPLARAILETRGWPVIFAGEEATFWLGRLQVTLAELLDNVAVAAVQREFGIAFEAYEDAQLARQYAAIVALHERAAALTGLELTGEQEVEYGIGIALLSVERLWRTGSLPADYWNAFDLIPGSRALFDSLSEFVPGPAPATGWDARGLMGRIIERVDDYLEIKAEVRPVTVLTHFVPALIADDADRPVGEVARVIIVPIESPLANEYSILILPHRDRLPFGFRQAFADDEAVKEFAGRLLQAPYGAFCRSLLPEAFCFWAPTGEAALPVEAVASQN